MSCEMPLEQLFDWAGWAVAGQRSKSPHFDFAAPTLAVREAGRDHPEAECASFGVYLKFFDDAFPISPFLGTL